MAYPSLSNYGDYSDLNHDQSMNNSYGNSRQSGAGNSYASQGSYAGDSAPSRYSSSGYGWSNQPQQQDYSNSSRKRATSNNDWNEQPVQSTTHEDRARAATSSSGHHYYNPASWTGPNTQGLNSLASASGLAETTLQRPGQHARTNTAHAPSYSSATTSHGLNRVQSPLNNHDTSRYNPSPSNYTYPDDSASSQTPNNTLSEAAAALAGAVSARFYQASATMGAQSSVSPVMENSSSIPQSAHQRSTSQYYQSQSSQPQAQTRQSTITSRPNHAAPGAASHQQRSQPSTSGPHGRAPSRNAVERPTQPQGLPINSISNLVTPSVEEPAQSQYSVTPDPQTMPNYIDPSRVFNPYAKEHERRRREAAAQAEADARKKAEEVEAAAAARRKADEEAAASEAQKKQAEAPPASKKRDGGAAAGAKGATKSQQKAPKATKQSASSQDQSVNAVSSQPDQPQNNSAAGETDMAAELKAMMDRMKEFRTKDPTLFQKLWDDMRKPASGPSAVVPVHSPSPQMSVQQNLPSRPQNPTVTASVPAPPQKDQSPPQHSNVGSTTKRSRARDSPVELPLGAKTNGYRVVVENNPEGLPDLGRFPAERRIRSHYQKRPDTSIPTQPPPDLSAQPEPVSASVSHPAAYDKMPLASGQAAVPPPAQTTPTPNPAIAPVEKKIPLSQGLPPRGPGGSTVWPEEKRNALAEAAVKSLKGVPENAGIEISPADIHTMLAQNPSYIDLCEMLEKKGFKFHRGHFARQLLSNVPYLNGPKATSPSTSIPAVAPLQPTPNQPNGTFSSALLLGATSMLPPPPLRTGNANFQPVNGPVKSVKSEFAAPHPSSMQRQRPPRGHALNRAEPPPGSKEAMARKRDFSELIDMTALSDTEDYVMSRKQPRLASPSPEPTNPFQQFENQISNDHQISGTYPGPGNPLPAQNGVPLRFDPGQPRYPQGYTPLPYFPYAPPPPPQHAPGPAPIPIPQRPPPKAFAKPVNKQSALLKTYYDAKTVARDILIAAGRHPTERPLNAHLAGLLGKHIEIDSDLSTFDWDAIDPGGPAVPEVPFVDVPMEPPGHRWGDQSIQRGRPANMKMQEPNPGDAGKTRLPNPDKREQPAPASSTVSATAQGTNGVVASSTKPGRKPASTSLVQVITDLGPSHLPRPRGRPGKRKAEPASTPAIQISPLPDRRRSTRSASTQLTPTAPPSTGHAQKMDTSNIFPSGKRKGRPPGSKNLHQSLGAMKKAAAQQLAGAEVASSSPPPPHNPIFKCRWRACQGHLHNLETLRKHISKVHRPTSEHLKAESGFICWWKKCSLLVADEDGQLGPSKIFENEEEWLAHIDKTHLRKIADKFGDGPSLKHTGKQEKRASFPFDVSKFSFQPDTTSPAPPSSSVARMPS